MNSTFLSFYRPSSSLWVFAGLLLAGPLGGQATAEPAVEGAVETSVKTAAATPAPTFESPCATEADFFGALAADHGVERAQAPYAQIRIHQEDTDYVLELEGRDGSQRTLRDSSCPSLVSAAVVIVTSAVQGNRASDVAVDRLGEAPVHNQSEGPSAPERLAPEEAVAVSKGAEPSSAVSELKRSSGDARAPARLRPWGFAGTGLSVALHPDVAVLVEGGLGLGLRRVGLTLLGRYQFPTESLTSETVGIRLESAGGRLGLYYAPAAWLHIETGPSVVGLSGVGVGLARPEASLVWMVAQELELSGRLPVGGPWLLEGGLRGWVSLNQPRFELDDGQEVYRVPRVGWGVFLHGIWQPQ